MRLSRRAFISSASAFSILAYLGVPNAQSHMSIASEPEDRKLIASVVRAMFPHDRFPDGPYLRTADAVIKKALGSPASALELRSGLAALKQVGFEKMSKSEALAYVKSMEGSPLFSLVHGTTVTGLYTDSEVHQLLGYEGSSFEKGGYIDRGFNDLNWLPEPRITEHPELAKFLGAGPKSYAVAAN